MAKNKTQFLNKHNGNWNLRDKSTGRIVDTQKTPFKNIPKEK